METKPSADSNMQDTHLTTLHSGKAESTEMQPPTEYSINAVTASFSQ